MDSSGGNVPSKEMTTSGSGTLGGKEGIQVPLVHDAMTFDSRQAMRLKEMEKRVGEETKRKKKEWEKDVERMREEFLNLYPCGKKWKSDEDLHENMVAKRRGSTDVLDAKKMKTLFLEYPDSGRRYKLRFNVAGFEPENIKVATDGDRIIVGATRTEEGDGGRMVTKEYERKIERPKEVDHTKLKSYLTTDGILIIEAPLPPKTLNLRKTNHPSPSRSMHGSNASVKSVSPVNSSPPPPPPTQGQPVAPQSPSKEKYGIPIYHDEGGRRKVVLNIDIGLAFSSKEITALIIKDNRIQVKAKHEERTPEKLSKSKYMKEFEMPEKIETYSLRGGLTPEGRLIVSALTKGSATGLTKVAAGDLITEDINAIADNVACNVLDLSSFPPTTPQLIASSYSYNG